MAGGGTIDGKKELQELFGGENAFPYPKSSKYISNIISLCSNKNALILDSFAGSGTTAHAVLKANAEDEGNRRFILVEMEEDIADTVTAERIRRVIAGYGHNGKSTEGLGGEFTYCTLGDALNLDKILTGETLPPFAALAPVLFHMATSQTLKTDQMIESRFYVGRAAEEHVWMVYRPDLDWLKSDEAALTLTRAREIFQTDPAARHLVFAPARFVSEKLLREEGLNVAFIPFPDSLYRIAHEG